MEDKPSLDATPQDISLSKQESSLSQQESTSSEDKINSEINKTATALTVMEKVFFFFLKVFVLSNNWRFRNFFLG